MEGWHMEGGERAGGGKGARLGLIAFRIGL